MAEKLNNQADEVIEDDELIEEIEEVEGNSSYGGDSGNFLQKYGKWIAVGAGVVLVAVVFFLWRGSKRQAASDVAQVDLIHAAQIYDQVMAGGGQQGGTPDSLLFNAINGGPGFKGFAKIAADAAGSKAGNLALYYLGTSYLRLGQIDKAIKELEAYDKGDDMIGASAYGALGGAYEEKGNWAKAIENYELASKTPEENPQTTPYWLMSVARCMEADKKPAEALEVYKRIRDQYPNSDEGKGADRYIGRLSKGKQE